MTAFSLLRHRAVVFLVCALAAALSAPAYAAKPAWLKLETDEFVIYSDAREKDVMVSALRYAAFRRAFDAFFVPVGGSLPTSALILFRNKRDFHALVPDTKERGVTTVNFSTQIDDTPLNAFPLSGDPQRALSLTIEFETVWGLRRLGFHVPIWMAQGTGGLLAEAVVRPGQVVIGDLGSQPPHDLPWPRFFETGQDSDAYRKLTRLGNYLAQTRALMHWILLRDDDTQARFHDLALRLRNTPGLAAVETVMATPVAGFDKAIKQHLRQNPQRTLVFDERAVVAGFRISPAPEAEVLALTAELLVAADRPYDAVVQLDRAWELAPHLPVVKDARARRLLREGRTREAIDLYREAIAAGSKNASAYIRSAEAHLDDARTNGQDIAGEGGLEAETAIRELRHAIRLNPGSPEAFHLLGRAFYVAGSITPENLDELNRGVFHGAAGHVVRLYRAALYERLGQPEDARAELRSLIAEADISPHNRNVARQHLAVHIFEQDRQATEADVQAGRYSAARERITAAAASPDIAPLSENYDRILAWVNENEAWSEIKAHADADRLDELRAAAESFAQRFPRSGRAAEARRLAQLQR